MELNPFENVRASSGQDTSAKISSARDRGSKYPYFSELFGNVPIMMTKIPMIRLSCLVIGTVAVSPLP